MFAINLFQESQKLLIQSFYNTVMEHLLVLHWGKMIIIETLEWVWKDSWFGKYREKMEEEKDDVKKDTLLDVTEKIIWLIVYINVY